MRITCLEVGPLGTNCYVVQDEATGEGLVIDPGGSADEVIGACREMGMSPSCIVNTHAHADHVGANAALKDEFPQAMFCIGAGEQELMGKSIGALGLLAGMSARPPEPDMLLEDGQELRVGECALRVIKTPGHTPCSICLAAEGEDPIVVFCGDLIFQSGVGRTDLPGGNTGALRDSIEKKIFSLPEQTVLLPGHGPATTVGAEKNAGYPLGP